LSRGSSFCEASPMAPSFQSRKAKGKAKGKATTKDRPAGKDKKSRKSLYELLRVPEGTSDPIVLQRAYRVLAREVHPDKHPEDPQAATVAFQQLARAHGILSDPVKRELYDRTGAEDDELPSGGGFDAAHAFSRRVTEDEFKQMIRQFEAEYKGSEHECADVLAHVRSRSGDVSRLLECVMLSRLEDGDRFVSMLKLAFSKGKLPKSLHKRVLETTPAMFQNAQRERKLFERGQKPAAAKKGSSTRDLALSIRASSQARRSANGDVLGAIFQADLADPLAGRDLADVRKQQGKSVLKRPSSKVIRT